ncbi:hypothetical protein M885DRAFT_557211 [Pelagophyceae sp. CCMP2097]|nr:hypothetical protein M885DRAFT_557211 [Pelagophyceae sp. CCMP2097]
MKRSGHVRYLGAGDEADGGESHTTSVSGKIVSAARLGGFGQDAYTGSVSKRRVLKFVAATCAETGKPAPIPRKTADTAPQRNGQLPAAAAKAPVPKDAFKYAALREWRAGQAGVGVGLLNLGNTCFVNSTVQCLAHTPVVAQLLSSAQFKQGCKQRERVAAEALREALKGALGKAQHHASKAAFAPRKLVAKLCAIAPHFQRHRQEDAHELLRAVLDVAGGGFADGAVDALFKGKLRSTLTCPTCDYASHSDEAFFDLSLEPRSTLLAAIAAFTKAELLDAQNRWRCGKCHKHVRATKQLSLAEAPEVCVVHLKRFERQRGGKKQRGQEQQACKLTNHVKFEAKLALCGASYALRAVLVHHGASTRSGHYSAFAQAADGAWYSYDDDMVRKVSEANVLNQKAYVLFYARAATAAAPAAVVAAAPKAVVNGAKAPAPPERAAQRGDWATGGADVEPTAAHLARSERRPAVDAAAAPVAEAEAEAGAAEAATAARAKRTHDRHCRLLLAQRGVSLKHLFYACARFGRHRKRARRLVLLLDRKHGSAEDVADMAPAAAAAAEARAARAQKRAAARYADYDDDFDGDGTEARRPQSAPVAAPAVAPQAAPQQAPLFSPPSRQPATTAWGALKVDGEALSKGPALKRKPRPEQYRYDNWDKALDAPRVSKRMKQQMAADY